MKDLNLENADPTQLYPQPKYDPNTGLPSDDNFEFFWRFVAKDESDAASSGKPFFWKQGFKKNRVKVSSSSYKNPVKSLKFDSKGVFFLNTDPRAYYIKFGFLLYLIEEKVIFRIDEQRSNHTDNTSIIKINYSSSADMFCINSDNT